MDSNDSKMQCDFIFALNRERLCMPLTNLNSNIMALDVDITAILIGNSQKGFILPNVKQRRNQNW